MKQRRKQLEALYAAYEQPMYRIAYAILRNSVQAEDAVSEAILKIMQHLEQLEAVEDPRTKQYVVQVIRNTAINQYRRNVRENQHTQEIDEETMQLADPADELEQHMRQTECRQEVQEILQQLSSSDRTLLELRCMEELPFREIAKRMSLRETTVRKRYERIRRTVQKQRKEHLYE